MPHSSAPNENLLQTRFKETHFSESECLEIFSIIIIAVGSTNKRKETRTFFDFTEKVWIYCLIS